MRHIGKSPLRAVLLDLDGTVIDTRGLFASALAHMQRKLGVPLTTEHQLAPLRGKPTREVLSRVTAGSDKALEVYIEACELYHDKIRVFRGVRRSLCELRSCGLALAVVTSQARSLLRSIRGHIGLDTLIDVWVSADDSESTKPDPAPVCFALEALDCPPEGAILIGDTRFDMEAGRRAGIRIGAALWGSVCPEELLDFRPDFTFETPGAMKQLCSLVTI